MLAQLSPEYRQDLKREFEEQIISKMTRVVTAATQVNTPKASVSLAELSIYERQHSYVSSLQHQHSEVLVKFDASPYYQSLREQRNHDTVLEQLHQAGYQGPNPIETLNDSRTSHLGALKTQDWDLTNVKTYPYALDFINGYLKPGTVMDTLRSSTGSLHTALLRLDSPYQHTYDARTFSENGPATLETDAQRHIESQQQLIRQAVERMGKPQTQARAEQDLDSSTLSTVEVAAPVLPHTLKQVKENQGKTNTDTIPDFGETNPPLLKR